MSKIVDAREFESSSAANGIIDQQLDDHTWIGIGLAVFALITFAIFIICAIVRSTRRPNKRHFIVAGTFNNKLATINESCVLEMHEMVDNPRHHSTSTRKSVLATVLSYAKGFRR
jgi:hypothetical protein